MTRSHQDPFESRLRDYMQERGEVGVPSGLLEAVTAASPAPRVRSPLVSLGALGTAAVAGVVIVAVVGAIVAGPLVPPSMPAGRPSGDPSSTPAPVTSAASPSGVPSAPTDDPALEGFPTEILGVRVHSVRDVLRLIDAGEHEGRAIAVAGVWSEDLPHSCPYPGWPADQTLLDVWQCWEPRVSEPRDRSTEVRPIRVPEMSGYEVLWESMTPDGDGQRQSAPVVVVGHVGDPRAWQCRPETRASCDLAFIVDRVAWVAGATVEPEASEVVRVGLDERIPSLASAEAQAIARSLADHDTVLGVEPMLGREVPGIDPRLHLVGDDIVWVARVMTGNADEHGTRALASIVFGDEDRSEIVRVGLAGERGPFARLRIEREGHVGQLWPHFAIDDSEGRPLTEGLVNDTINGGALPAVLEPGSYRVRAWLAEPFAGFGVDAGRRCILELSLQELDEVALDVRFAEDDRCTWDGAPTGPPTTTASPPPMTPSPSAAASTGTNPPVTSPSPLAPSPSADPVDELPFSCGGHAFTASLFDEPGRAELEDHPSADALRTFLASPNMDADLLPESGWHLVGRDDAAASYVTEVPGDPPFASAGLERDADGWRVAGWGQCRPMLVTEGLSIATWIYAPDQPVPGRNATEFAADVTELACTGATPVDDRLLPPTILYTQAEILVVFASQPLPGDTFTCPGNPSTRVMVQLSEPVGDRQILDGSSLPPRDPTREWP